MQRYAMLTVDTEAMPRRASDKHIVRLILGCHDRGTAGVREMCMIGDEYNAKHVFFVDLCSTYHSHNEMREVVRWLVNAGQDVQLHTHPEVLPDVFWLNNGFGGKCAEGRSACSMSREEYIIKYFGSLLSGMTGSDVLAFRSGSFRWGACTIRALKTLGVPLSFNNSMRAYSAGKCPFSLSVSTPYRWSNGVIEVPLTEKLIAPEPGGREFWASMTYPESSYYMYKRDRIGSIFKKFCRGSDFAVILLHSWSLLDLDRDGCFIYRDDKRLEGYRKYVSQIVKDYDVITTPELLDLCARGKIRIPNVVDLSLAERVN